MDLFITFEGIEGCGKTTQVKRLVKRLNSEGISLVTTLEPGGTRIGKSIRHILLDASNRDLSPLAELILYIADRAQHVEEVIKPALDQGKWVICDRFFDATLAYQGTARGQDMELIRILNNKATHGIRPDITFLLDCPVEMGLDRALKRNRDLSQEDQDRFERERLEFHREVRKGYLELARKEDKRFVVINAALTEDDVEQEIFQSLSPILDEKREEGVY
ncbi:MAG: dTMP kinase [Deltaproteobacteria bacterium]|nr:dTMP kinase [Deltaproteobacteria bacterium]